MGTDAYVLALSIAFYVMMMKAIGTRNISATAAATSSVLVPFIFAKILWYMHLTGYHLPLSQLVGVADIVVLVLQLIAALAIFHKLQQEEDTIASWLIWGASGCVLIYFIVPYLVRLIV